jgi:hypothetical protein
MSKESIALVLAHLGTSVGVFSRRFGRSRMACVVLPHRHGEVCVQHGGLRDGYGGERHLGVLG